LAVRLNLPRIHTFYWPKRVLLWLCVLASGVAVPAGLAAVTLRELTENPKINPKKFASYFSSFAYEFNGPIQSPSTFLQREKGDCDDYSVLADLVLSRNHYTTRLVHVRLAGRVAHAVCYINESKAYLDYNNRAVFFTLTRSGSDLREIANKVAASLEASWTTASEFTYSYETRRKTMITTVSQTGGKEAETPAASNHSSAFNVD
jgi:hypothetical protein